MKFATLAELAQAAKAGTLPGPLMIDNDNVSVWDDDADEEAFSMHPADLLEQALELLGIPAESV